MRKAIVVFFVLTVSFMASTSCRMQPSRNLGDTVEAKYFEPADTATLTATRAKATDTTTVDSSDIFYIGNASTRRRVQLVGYPHRQDSAIYAKGKHVKVKGNADFGHVVRAKFYITDKGDTLVTLLEEWKPAAANQ